MFTLAIIFKNKNGIFKSYYCKKFKGVFVLSSQKECALSFKKMRSAKRSINTFIKKYAWHLNGYGDITGYEIDLVK